MGKILEICWKNFFEICTTVYKAGLSKVGDLYNLVTKTVTKYPVLATLKILQNYEKKSPIFEKILRNEVTKNFFKKIGDVFFVILRIFKVART